MLVTTAAIIVGLGWAAFIVGFIFNIYELGVLGGIIVLGVGAVVAGGVSLEEVSGEIETANNDGTVTTETQTSEVATPQKLSIGGIFMLIGGVQVLRSFERFARM
jgi:hypothetical protein